MTPKQLKHGLFRSFCAPGGHDIWHLLTNATAGPWCRALAFNVDYRTHMLSILSYSADVASGGACE